MKTLKLNTRKEVLDFLDDFFYTDALKDYAYSLRDFFIRKNEYLIDALAGHESAVKYCEDTYGIIDPKCFDLRINHNNWHSIDSWLYDFDSAIEEVIESELNDPISIDYEEGDEEDARGELLEAFTERHFTPFFTFKPNKLMGIREMSYGMKEDDQYHEMLKFYE